MKKKGQDGNNVFLLDPYDRYKYYLQRLRLILSSKTHIFEVVDMADLPTESDRDQFPCIEVKIRLRAMWLKHPITGKPILSEARIKDCVEGWPMQEQFVKGLAEYLADTIPSGSPAESLRSKFYSLQEGQRTELPPNADLRLTYDLIKDQADGLKKRFREYPNRSTKTIAELHPDFLACARKCFWWEYVERGAISFEAFENGTPSEIALEILVARYGVEEDTINSHLFRRKKSL